MRDNGFWKVFRDTGDPLCYVIARRIEKDSFHSGTQAANGHSHSAGSLIGTASANAKN
jgi:hypothetical protein